ncbi:hypothetical protein J2Z40_003598 [Cytobacillus eiseniae]|uniref:Uncharacterized protein n=1 Tax=Cytobacillus eiseniae TaxID=762947 RepID=A0ABS4RJD5_9BACI|nr:hypothetical protein [Cytobacillus eiseniae]MBP2243016.1 hypothetical protein [Cytobacillus eiseniae]
MSNKEEEYLLNEANKNEGKTPIFGPPDGKILATGDLFRGPSTGFTSDFDPNNSGNNMKKKDERFD